MTVGDAAVFRLIFIASSVVTPAGWAGISDGAAARTPAHRSIAPCISDGVLASPGHAVWRRRR